MKIYKSLSFLALTGLASLSSNAQVLLHPPTGEYFIKGNSVEIGISNDYGFEGANCLTTAGSYPAGMHFRTNTQYFGFVANPQLNAWLTFDGDFFTPGTPENGWGVEIGGVAGNKFHNNCNFETDIPGNIIYTEDNSGCYTAMWKGDLTAGYDLDFFVTYDMNENDLYYTTKVDIVNNSGVTVDDIYYYRNVDPDNNIILSGTYVTTNTVIDQPDGVCNKAHVSATTTGTYQSYVGFAGIDPNFRVGHGGFANRDGSDMWNGVGFTSAVGGTTTSDIGMFITYFIDQIAPGDTASFKFVVILDDSQAENAINSLIYFDYSGGLGTAPPVCASIDTIPSCPGKDVTIDLAGFNVNDFTWTWSPPDYLNTTTGSTVIASPTETVTYTATGTPINACFTIPITMSIVVEMSESAAIDFEVGVVNPICNDDNGSLEVINISGGIGSVDVQWTGGPNTALYDSLVAGSYEVILTDSFGCYIDSIIYLDNVTPLTGTITVDSFAECSQPIGQFTVVGSGTSAPYTYDIGLGPNTTGVFSGLTDSTYVVEITDSFGCIIYEPVYIPDTSTLNVSLVNQVNIQCGLGLGQIEVAGTGGALPYTFTLGTTTQSTTLFDSLGAGTYNVIITGMGGCTDTVTATITDSMTLITTLVDTTTASCGLPNGGVEVTASNGGASYTFTVGSTSQSTGTFTGLLPGSYTMNVVSGTCNQTVPFVIADSDNLQTTLVDTNEQVCNTLGQVTVSVTGGGTGTVNFSVPGFGTNSTGIFDLPDGSYTMTITSGTCIETEPFVIGFNPGNLTLSVDEITEENCGLYNGEIVTLISGVTGNPSNVSYTLNTVPTTSTGTFSNLGDGIYVIQATDENGCTDTTTALVGEIPISIDLGADRIECNAATLTTQEVGSITWSYLDTVPVMTIGTTSSVTVTESGTYVLEVATAECYDSDTVELEIYLNNFVIVPNVFTPNGDNTNETFEVQGIFVETYHISIFNRWGQLMFTSDNISDAWDGKFNGNPAGEGTYMYIITYMDPCQTPPDQTVTGTLQLFR